MLMMTALALAFCAPVLVALLMHRRRAGAGLAAGTEKLAANTNVMPVAAPLKKSFGRKQY